MDQITAKLDEIDSLTAALGRAYRVLAAIAEAEGKDHDPIRNGATQAAELVEKNAQAAIARRLLAEIRRPKGPMVSLRWTGDGSRGLLDRDVTRRATRRSTTTSRTCCLR